MPYYTDVFCTMVRIAVCDVMYVCMYIIQFKITCDLCLQVIEAVASVVSCQQGDTQALIIVVQHDSVHHTVYNVSHV